MKKINSSIFTNTASYYLINFSDYFISFLILPFLARTIKMEGLGLLGIVNSLGIVCLLLMEYGFSLSATREIASNKNQKYISKFVGKVLTTKLLLILPCAVISLISLLYIPVLKSNQLIVFLTFIISILNGFTPLWYFQGIQKIFPFAILKIILRLITIIPIFFIVRSVNDIWLILLLQSIYSFFICSISMGWLFKKTQFSLSSIKDAKFIFKNGWHTFSLTIIPPLFTMFGFYWLSTKLSIESMGLLNSADRIFKALISLFGPLGQAIYPYIISQFSNDQLKAISQTKKAFWFYSISATSVSIIIFSVAEPFISLFLGNDYLESSIILKILVLSIPIIKISYIIGRQWMLSIKLDRIVSISVFVSNLVFLVALIFLFESYKIYVFPISLIIAEFSLLIFYIFYLHWNKLGFWNSSFIKNQLN